MKRRKQPPKEEKMVDILKKLTKRVEEATVDIHEMKSDLRFVNLKLGSVESNTKVMKIDMEKLRDIVDEVKKNTDDLIETTEEVLANMVTRKEFQNLSERVSVLENH